VNTTQAVLTRSGHLAKLAVVSELSAPAATEGALGCAGEDVVSGLPAAVSSFVGRDHEMKAVAKLLETARLVTLRGGGGVGKTRLALEVAAVVAKRSAEKVRLVELALVADPALVPAAVAGALRVREQPGRSLVETLISHLRHRRLLLVVDNCEHVVDAAAELIQTLLRGCADLRILATSRQQLGITGEGVWLVPPLSVPPAAEMFDVELSAYGAVRLFVTRAAESAPGFALTAAVAPAVAEICRRLDGVPLAIELAASRVQVLSPMQIAARLDDRFGLLAAGSRTISPCHHSLQAALDWSYDLLSDSEQVLLCRLSVFVGGCTLEAAEQICTGEALESDQVVDLMTGLVAKSLVVADTSGAQARYRLLETIRHYAADKLTTSGQTETLRQRHAAWCIRLAEQAEPELSGPHQVVWIGRLDAEHANLRAALGWSLDCGQSEQGLRLATVLAWFWGRRGYFSEGKARLEQALAACPDAPVLLRCKALGGIGFLASWAGDFATAVALGKDSLALAYQLGDTRGAARALSVMGLCIGAQEPAKARPVLQESVTLARQVHDTWCLASSLNLLGFTAIWQGDCVTARPPLEECLALTRETQDKQNLSIALIGLGHVAAEEGDHQSAEALLHEGLAIARKLGDPWWTELALLYLGELARTQAEFTRARTLVEEGLALARERECGWAGALALWFLGKIAQAEGDVDFASRHFAQALPLAQAIGNKRIVAGLLLGQGEIAQTLGDPATARARIDKALTLARESGAKHLTAQACYRLGQLAQSQGDHYQAETSYHHALGLWEETGRLPNTAKALEALAGLAADQDRGEYAARLFAAAHAFWETTGCLRPPSEQATYDADLTAAQQGLFSDEFAAAWEQGHVLSMREAVAYAVKGRGPRQRPTTGPASLTPAEHQVARLAADGLTNPEIGQRLFVSRRTVQTHLAHVYAKLGISSRKQLTQQINQREM
jgi:predicted ATPase/DNA-binding CsgD family transcriptional regulator/Tfp pilus assembly protein PilF